MLSDEYLDKLICKINDNAININSLLESEKQEVLKYAYRKSIEREETIVLSQKEYEEILSKQSMCSYYDSSSSDCLCHHCINY